MKHKHHDLVLAWLNGKEIEFFVEDTWCEIQKFDPSFSIPPFYQDIDGKDEKALHILGYYNGDLAAYSRLFNKGYYFEETSIGRVLVSPKYRDKKFGHDLMRVSIAAIKENFNETAITISAQEYLKKFYESHGFIQTSEMYLEDDIPHIQMKRS